MGRIQMLCESLSTGFHGMWPTVEIVLEFFLLETLTKINMPLKWNRPGKQNKTHPLTIVQAKGSAEAKHILWECERRFMLSALIF